MGYMLGALGRHMLVYSETGSLAVTKMGLVSIHVTCVRRKFLPTYTAQRLAHQPLLLLLLLPSARGRARLLTSQSGASSALCAQSVCQGCAQYLLYLFPPGLGACGRRRQDVPADRTKQQQPHTARKKKCHALLFLVQCSAPLHIGKAGRSVEVEAEDNLHI